MDAGNKRVISTPPPVIQFVADDVGLDRDRVPPATLLLRYEKLEWIAEGATGTIFRGWDARLGRAVAVKLLKSDAPSDTRRFIAEARAQARLRHENVCQVYEAGEADGEPYIIMEFIEGKSLDEAHVGMTLEQKVKLIREVAAGLHEAHRLGMVHRDVKPGNIMVAQKEDDSYKPYIVDFGLARDLSSTGVSTQNGIVGTPAYMSPEQAMGTSATLDRRSDVYSLGATLYYILAGRTPFVSANALTLLTQVIYEDAPPLGKVRPGTPKQLETIVMKCLEREPERRYESARVLGEDLQRFLDGVAIQAKPPPMRHVLLQKAKRYKALVSVAAIGLSLALVLAALWVRTALRAAEQAELARELGEDVKYVELFLRTAYSLPTHDISREEKIVRSRLVEIEKRMANAGPISRGPGHYALGRAYLALHEYAIAQEHLERAIRIGYERPEVHYALGLALSARYHVELDSARHIDDITMRNDAKKKASITLRTPALVHLRQTGQTQIESKAYIEGLIALYEQRFDDATRAAAAAIEEAPWLYEAHKLQGDAYLEQGTAIVESGQTAQGRSLLHLATIAYESAANIARSDTTIHEALAESWIQILSVDKWESVPYQPELDAILKACNNAIASSPFNARAYTKRGRAYYHVADILFRTGSDPRETLKLAIASARAARQIEPNNVVSLDGIGIAYVYLAKYERKIGLDPLPSLQQAVKEFDEANRIQATFAWPWNDAGIALQASAEYESDTGKDPRPTLDKAAEKYTRASREDASYIAPFGNLAWLYAIRAGYEASIGLDPRPTVQRAVEQAERGSKMDPKWLPLLNNRGWAELVAAQYELDTRANPSQTLDRVEASFQASLDINKDEADTQFGMGAAKHVRALYAMNQRQNAQAYFDAARTHLEQAAKLDAQEPGIRLELGQLYLTLARHALDQKQDPAPFLADAERVFRDGLRVNVRHAPLHAALAEALALQAEYIAKADTDRDKLIADGLTAVDTALAQNPNWALAFAARGTLYSVRANLKKNDARSADEKLAAEAFDQALRINKNLPERMKRRREALPSTTNQP